MALNLNFDGLKNLIYWPSVKSPLGSRPTAQSTKGIPTGRAERFKFSVFP